jgi:hypothetical protein
MLFARPLTLPSPARGEAKKTKTRTKTIRKAKLQSVPRLARQQRQKTKISKTSYIKQVSKWSPKRESSVNE